MIPFGLDYPDDWDLEEDLNAEMTVGERLTEWAEESMVGSESIEEHLPAIAKVDHKAAELLTQVVGAQRAFGRYVRSRTT